MRLRVLITLLAAAACLTLCAAHAASAQPPAPSPSATPSPSPDDPKRPFEIQKLQEEIKALQTANAALDLQYKWATAWITAFGGIFTAALGTLATFTIGLAAYFLNRVQGRKLVQDKRLGREEHLLKVFRDLGSEEPRVRVGAAAVLVQRLNDLRFKREQAERKEMDKRVSAALRWTPAGRLWRLSEREREVLEDAAEEQKEFPTIVSVLISVTKHEKSVEIQKYIADGIAEGLGALIDPEQTQRGKVPRPSAAVSPMKEYYFQGAQLQNAWWYSIDARGVDFYGANLTRAGLREAYLEGAILKGADLTKAVLEKAYLRRAQLQKAVLTGANLKEADLRRADLSGADLSGADLSGAKIHRLVLKGAELRGVTLSPEQELEFAEALERNSEGKVKRTLEGMWCKLPPAAKPAGRRPAGA